MTTTKYTTLQGFTDDFETNPVQIATLRETAHQAQNILTICQNKLKDFETQHANVEFTNKPMWDAYRQALKDVPLQTGFPWTITWPEVS